MKTRKRKKRKKDPLKKRLTKLRAAARNVWRFDFTHKQKIDEVLDETKHFLCPVCNVKWPSWAADVDHEPPVGEFKDLNEYGAWVIRLFDGPTQVLCKTCHKKKPKKKSK